MMDLRESMRISASGLTAQRTKLNVIAENLANAETTRTEEGGPYRRKMVILRANPEEQESFKNELEKQKTRYESVEVADIVDSQDDFRMVYNPGHPDADPVTGYVAMPNVDHLTEMADMMIARRAYEANATVIANTRAMILKALEIGR